MSGDVAARPLTHHDSSPSYFMRIDQKGYLRVQISNQYPAGSAEVAQL